MMRILTIGFFILTAASMSFAQASSNCNSNEDDNIAAVYNFVPENALQADFRRLSKTEEGFIDSLRQNPDIFVEDHTTQILSEEMMPEVPPISDALTPPPAQSGADFYFKGKISKTTEGFLLTVDLKKPSDDSLLNEVKIPFAAAAGAEAAGTTAATQMLTFLATQTQAARADHTNGDRLVNPQVILQIDKLLIKPNEQDHGKVILSDCDGSRLKNREFESYARLDRGATLLGELSGPRRTDDKGEYAGVLSSTVTGVLTQVARLKYMDLLGRPQTVSASQSVVIAGGEGDLWQMSIKFMYVQRGRYLAKDLQAHRTNISSTLVSRKADMIFLFKTPTAPNGEVSTDQIKTFNGFGEAVYRYVDDEWQDENHKSYAQGLLDQSPEAAQNVKASFSIDPGAKEFRFEISNLLFRGMRDSIGCAIRSGCQTRHEEYVVSSDGADRTGASVPITPEMTKSGVYTYVHQEKQMLPANHTKGATIDQTSEGSFQYNQIEVKISRISPKQARITR